MKRIIIITAVALPLAFSARAQYIVYDPKSDIQQILDTAQQIAKQVEEIGVLTSQLNEFKNYESLFGNPSQVVLSMATPSWVSSTILRCET